MAAGSTRIGQERQAGCGQDHVLHNSHRRGPFPARVEADAARVNECSRIEDLPSGQIAFGADDLTAQLSPPMPMLTTRPAAPIGGDARIDRVVRLGTLLVGSACCW